MLDTFDWLGYGAVLIDRDGQVVDINKQAENHLGTSIEVVRGQLTARDRRAKEGLQDLVASFTGDRGKLGGAPSAVLLPQPNGRPVVAYMAPASSALRESVPGLGGIILLLDPNNSREPSESLLQEVFGFTRAEVRLALGLVKHHDLRSVAEVHNVSVGTLRVQLKSIFAKTNTKRQGQLLTLLAQLSLCPK
jgi:DNA-binding CsgD family transcriptional regulator